MIGLLAYDVLYSGLTIHSHLVYRSMNQQDEFFIKERTHLSISSSTTLYFSYLIVFFFFQSLVHCKHSSCFLSPESVSPLL